MSAKFPRGGGANPFSAIRLIEILTDSLMQSLKYKMKFQYKGPKFKPIALCKIQNVKLVSSSNNRNMNT